MDLKNDKRVTVKLKCPNPLFEEWLIMWRDEAEAKDSKLKYSFNLALKSLRQYPLPFESGRDCKILKGFGDKLCKMLDDKLKKYLKVEKVNTPKNTKQVLQTDNSPEKTAPSGKKYVLPQVGSGPEKRASSGKTYVPQFGSGGYAILIALYKQSLQPDYQGFLRKNEIIDHGKELVNSSFTKPEPGSRYTAWSSMQTLLKKNLVSKFSHPPKFSLTNEGSILAKRLFENSNASNNCNAYRANISMNTNITNVNTKEYGKICTSYDPVTFSSEMENNILLKHKIPLSQCNAYGIFDKDKLESSKSNTNIQNSLNFQNNFVNTVETNKSHQIGSSSEKSSSSHSLTSESSLVQTDILWEEVRKKQIKKYSSTDSVYPINKVPKSNTLQKYSSSSSVTSTLTASVDNFVIGPYGFDIILYVDNNETSGSSSNESDAILIGLNKSGIKYEVKNLKVGDFTWICRDKTTKKELVLPYVIERKRMDDFAKSIKDKRYQEQKFRLKKSGIENLIYLVESHGRNIQVGLPLQTLYQAATNTAIQEGFFVKFTENTKETVEYLVNLSYIIINNYKSKTVASCAREDILPIDINTDLISLMTFKEFNESSVKNKKMKITDLFVKMLIQIKGMSVERALSITQQYATPVLLKTAYERNPEKVGENLLANIKYGVYNKNIGSALSKTVYQAFTKLVY